MAQQRSQPEAHAKALLPLLFRSAIVIAALSAVLAFFHVPLRSFIDDSLGGGRDKYAIPSGSDICRQEAKLSPTDKKAEEYVRQKVESPVYHSEIIDKLSGIIQIPSESYDELGPIGSDSRWDVFYKIEEYIKAKYPTLLKHVTLEHANTHGLILTWRGSLPATEAKPLLMLAHQDVVPVLADTVQDWTHPPYKGHFDGKIIWGRGATDDKGYMISILESVELLIKSGFKPSRTVILAFGCDEEISGENCGRPIADFLHRRYGDEGIYLIMDEGSMGIQKEFNQSFAMVSVAEKGYLDVGINVTATGGHASNPPDHNVIGVMSEIVMAIEANPFPGRVTAKNPMFGFLECSAVHAPRSSVPAAVRSKLSRVGAGDVQAQEQLAHELDDMRYYFRTSQSVGKMNGGVKINAIPEVASTMVNLRLAVESSIKLIEEHYENLVRPIAQKHGMVFEGFHSSYGSPERRKVSLYGVDALEPAPVSPLDSESWRVLSGTIRNTLRPLDNDSELIVTPYLMPANTDTKFFWALTKNIYRFTPINLVHNLNRAHTTDEFIRADEFVREPLFFATLILNADDAALGARTQGNGE
ncbi:carboxypeptidase yscS [Purpureocillium lavendulum]|uniref:Carboxypeptidase yscS n=1 Tax=Purpureocillium lavendulum TaxID=1247861 RepID=A0AB34FWX8_9HYPO|nr:carboxypeptidase yscS [Purpureocillium lavendulum]